MAHLRRRLTVDQCEAVKTLPGGGGATDDLRGLVKELKGENLMDLVAKADPKAGRRQSFSLGSNTDKNLKRRASFDAKDEVVEGDKDASAVRSRLEQMSIGAACKKGLKPESPNQDSFSVVNTDTFRLYGVYDGHGPAGHDVSQFARENITKLFLKHASRESDPEKALVDSFVECQRLMEFQTSVKEFDCTMSGATCTVVYYPFDKKHIVVAHVGDSRCILGQKVNGKWVAKDLTVDHKPDLPEEKKRIEKAGGRVVFDGYFNHRVFTKDGRGGLNMSRALGDSIAAKAGVSSVPETKIVSFESLGVKGDQADELCLIIATDGVWEFIQSKEAVEIVTSYKRDKAQDACEDLAKKSWDRWIEDSEGEVSDDITAVVTYFTQAELSSK